MAELHPRRVHGQGSHINARPFPYVFLPHLVSVLAGLVPFLFGILGLLGHMTW